MTQLQPLLLAKIRADGAVLLPDETVSAAGEITAEQTISAAEIGLNYIPIVETMPPSMGLGDGQSFAADQRITWIRPLLHNTRGLTVNGQIIPDRQTDLDPLDTTPPAHTEFIEARPASNNWQKMPTVTFTQNDPHPMTILAAVMRIEANQI